MKRQVKNISRYFKEAIHTGQGGKFKDPNLKGKKLRLLQLYNFCLSFQIEHFGMGECNFRGGTGSGMKFLDLQNRLDLRQSNVSGTLGVGTILYKVG